jgi:hypothetical protein
MSLATIAWGFLGGIFGWVVTTFIAQPVTMLLAARSEAAQALAQFEHCDDFNPHDEQQTPPSDAVVAARGQAYANCGAKLAGFDLSNQIFSRALRWRFIKWNPKSAGNELLLLAQLKPGSRFVDDTRQNVFKALRLGRSFGNKDDQYRT